MTSQPTVLRLPRRGQGDFAEAVLQGLAARPRVIPARFLYDRAGSELFERITALTEYYPTRTETGLLARHAGQIAAAVGQGRAVIEFGSGSCTKTPLLLSVSAPCAYVPIDISDEFLHDAASRLARLHPEVPVVPMVADFSRKLTLPAAVRERAKLGFFPGSTIGNFSHAAAIDLLRAFRATLGEDAWLVIGMDRRKDPARLVAAYDDAAGVTALFNRNLLHRINRELGGTIPAGLFAHVVCWNEDHGRIELHLRAERSVSFLVCGERFSIGQSESIHTENSHKYTDPETRLMARAAGWRPAALWTDDEGLFGLHLWQAAPLALEP